MITHRNYFEIEADSYFELGLLKGEMFGDFLHETLEERNAEAGWKAEWRRAKLYQRSAARAFPQLIDELKGYAEGADVSFGDLWALCIEDEVSESPAEKCTTIVTNGGSLVAHNEDWEGDAANSICVLRKSVGNTSIFELAYLNGLGGNSMSINSHGFVHAVNSVTHTDRQIGVPKNLVARWLSETYSPSDDLAALARLRRASGYHHCLVGLDGQLWSMECSATQQVLKRPAAPFVHTNHYLTRLSALERERDVWGTRRRYCCAMANVRSSMSLEDVKALSGNTSAGKEKSILNDNTIARMILDLPTMTAHVWLRREAAAGWVAYPLGMVEPLT
jgi:isopenicillin-N N-acyltransferase-like protein